MAKRLDLLSQPAVVEEFEEADMDAEEEEMWDLVCQRTKKVLDWVVTERMAGRVPTDTTACWAAVRATAGPQERQAAPPSLRLFRSGKVKEKAAEEMPQPPIKCVGREQPQAPDAAAQIGEEEDGREAASASFTDGCSIRVV